jgi:hypothetical protein
VSARKPASRSFEGRAIEAISRAMSANVASGPGTGKQQRH